MNIYELERMVYERERARKTVRFHFLTVRLDAKSGLYLLSYERTGTDYSGSKSTKQYEVPLIGDDFIGFVRYPDKPKRINLRNTIRTCFPLFSKVPERAIDAAIQEVKRNMNNER